MPDDTSGAGGDSVQRAELQQIYAGAEEAGLRLLGISEVEVGTREGVPGNVYTLTVRVDENGNPIPRRGETDRAAASLLRLTVYPQTAFDSDGKQRIVWLGYARQVDVGSRRIFAASTSGATDEERESLQGGQEPHVYLDDASFLDGMVELSAATPGEAAEQALADLANGSGGLNEGREQRTVDGDDTDGTPAPTWGSPALSARGGDSHAMDMTAVGDDEDSGGGGTIGLSSQDDPTVEGGPAAVSTQGGFPALHAEGGRSADPDSGDGGEISLKGVGDADDAANADIPIIPVGGDIVVDDADSDPDHRLLGGSASVSGGFGDSDEGASGAGGAISFDADSDDEADSGVLWARESSSDSDQFHGDDDAEPRFYSGPESVPVSDFSSAAGDEDIGQDGVVSPDPDPDPDDGASSRSKLTLALVGTVGVIVIVVLALQLGGGSDDPEPAASPQPTPAEPVASPDPEPADDPPPPPAATPTPTPAPEQPQPTPAPPANDPEPPPEPDAPPADDPPPAALPEGGGLWSGTFAYEPLGDTGPRAFESSVDLSLEPADDGGYLLTLTQQPRGQITTGLLPPGTTAALLQGGDPEVYFEFYVLLLEPHDDGTIDVGGLLFTGAPALADHIDQVIANHTFFEHEDGFLFLTTPVLDDVDDIEEAIRLVRRAPAEEDPAQFFVMAFLGIGGGLQPADG